MSDNHDLLNDNEMCFFRDTRQRICVSIMVTTHVETVCLLSKLHEAKHHVNVKLDMDEMDLTSAEE